VHILRSKNNRHFHHEHRNLKDDLQDVVYGLQRCYRFFSFGDGFVFHVCNVERSFSLVIVEEEKNKKPTTK